MAIPQDRISQSVLEVLEQGNPARETISQEVLEIIKQLPPVHQVMTQEVLEVVLATFTGSITAACPLNNTAFVGAAYAGSLTAFGGGGTYTFTLLS